MRGPWSFVLVVLLLLGGAALWWALTAEPALPSPAPSPSPPSPASPPTPGTRNDTPAASTPPDTPPRRPAPDGAAAQSVGGNLLATRAQPTTGAPAKLADAPTAWLRVLEHGTQLPVVGAGVRSLHRTEEIAFADEQGLVPLPLVDREQLAVVREGYLLRLAPTRVGSTATEPQQVALVPDRWSLPRRVEFTGGDGAEVFLRLRPRDPMVGQSGSPVPATDDVLRRAWNEHCMLAQRPCGADARVQLPIWSEERVHRLRSGDTIRFAQPGVYFAEAATATGLVARGEFLVGRDDAPLRLTMQRGGALAGQVVDAATGAALAGASLQLQGSDPLGLMATTDGSGEFRLTPLLPGSVTLHVRHDDAEPLAFGPVNVPAAGVRIALQPLPRSGLRGRVRMRPDLAPVAGAAVVWLPEGKAQVATTTRADGTFVLQATGTTAARLRIQAPDAVAYVELVDPGAPFADYDVWPANQQVRLQKGLTAVFAGVLTDAVGRPEANVAVRWEPRAPASPPVDQPLRRVIDGARMDLSPVTTTAADGSFRLETDQFGAGRLRRADDPDVGLDTVATAGQITDGLRMKP